MTFLSENFDPSIISSRFTFVSRRSITNYEATTDFFSFGDDLLR